MGLKVLPGRGDKITLNMIHFNLRLEMLGLDDSVDKTFLATQTESRSFTNNYMMNK